MDGGLDAGDAVVGRYPPGLLLFVPLLEPRVSVGYTNLEVIRCRSAELVFDVIDQLIRALSDMGGRWLEARNWL